MGRLGHADVGRHGVCDDDAHLVGNDQLIRGGEGVARARAQNDCMQGRRGRKKHDVEGTHGSGEPTKGREGARRA